MKLTSFSLRPSRRRHTTIEAFVFLVLLVGVFVGLGTRMGSNNLMNTIMNTAHNLLLNTVFYLMGITVLTGALSKLLSEFGVVSLIEKLLRPLMKPLYNLPGVAALGGVLTFLSDNPAIIAFAKDKTFSSYFKKYQLLSLTNFGTAFGMGLVVMFSMIGVGSVGGAFAGLFGAVCGSIISTRIMQRSCLKAFPELIEPVQSETPEQIEEEHLEHERERREGVFMRFLNALLDGGKNGVELGLAIIPGVLIITTMVILLTFGAGPDGYTGAANQGVPVLPCRQPGRAGAAVARRQDPLDLRVAVRLQGHAPDRLPDDLAGLRGRLSRPAAHLPRRGHPGRQRDRRVHRHRHVLERIPVHPHRDAGHAGLPVGHLQGPGRPHGGRPVRRRHRALRVPAVLAAVGLSPEIA